MTHHPDSEAALEQETIVLLAKLGWETTNAFSEAFSPAEAAPGRPYLGRRSRSEVILRARLQAALERLNPDLPPAAFGPVLDNLARHRGAQDLAAANADIYRLLKTGDQVIYRDAQGQEQAADVRLIDWRRPERNDFRLVAQLWVAGETAPQRADLVGFVNGLPLLFIELKRDAVSVRQAYDDNLRRYKETIPALFWYNGLIILSNGDESRAGSLTAAWEHFGEWKRINAEGETGLISLETTLRATCSPARLLDLVENFTLFTEDRGGLRKLVAKNHQYLGVNNALAAVRNIRTNQGRLGVFWHTQGSGKSYAMIFLAQKTLRYLPGNWTFVIVTDRKDLDQQIYKTFARAGVVTESEEAVRARSGAHLQRLLRDEDHRYLFTLIHKFQIRTPDALYPVLSERADIIVIVDEAHRSQYDALALNMRRALPHAAFIAFTGTPLLAGGHCRPVLARGRDPGSKAYT